MFSFFKSKKPSPPSSPEPDPVPGPNADGFVVIDSRPGNGNFLPPTSSLYPNFDGNFGNIGPVPPIPNAMPNASAGAANSTHVNYLSGVPFKLSSELSTGDQNEIMKIQVDDILAVITSKMQMEDKNYDFGLERSIIAQG